MRFDDMLATLLAQPAPTPEARAILWRQVVDVLAQGRGHHVDDPLVDAPRAVDAYNFLRSVRPQIAVDLRLAAGRGLAGRRVPPELALLFAEDLPHIAAPMLGNVLLGPRQWIDLLPRLTPSARNLLRNRRDLGPDVELALEGYGSTDLLIQGPVEATEAAAAPLALPIEELVAQAQPAETPIYVPMAPAAVDDVVTGDVARDVAAPPEKPAVAEASSESQIRDLLSRIETFRSRHPAATPVDGEDAASIDLPAGAGGGAAAENFRFETCVDGVISWVQGVARGPVIGETIAVAAHQTDHGVDGHAAGAYRSRTPFRDARLTIAGQGPASGEWRISAVPFFDSKDGRFSGYRGTARRPRADESATAMGGEARRADPAVANDSLRHLVHELRTPLNAIIGFSEMIEGQVRGPAAAAYRGRAQEILEQSRKLLSAVEDLDLVAATRAAEPVPSAPAPVDAAAILARLHANFEAVAKERASGLAFRIDSTLPPVAVDAPTVERMLSRLLAATIAMAEEGERISVDLQRDPRRSTHLLLTILRPRALSGRDEKMLLDPGYNPDGQWPDAPVLGLGFALRLVRNLAIASGGMLEMDATRFHLSLPLSDHGGRAEQDAI